MDSGLILARSGYDGWRELFHRATPLGCIGLVSRLLVLYLIMYLGKEGSKYLLSYLSTKALWFTGTKTVAYSRYPCAPAS
jgi:hypothetical protein